MTDNINVIDHRRQATQQHQLQLATMAHEDDSFVPTEHTLFSGTKQLVVSD